MAGLRQSAENVTIVAGFAADQQLACLADLRDSTCPALRLGLEQCKR